MLNGIVRTAARLVGTAVGGTVGVAGGLADVAGLVSSALTGEPWNEDGHAHVPIRGVHREDSAADAAEVERLLGAHAGVSRVEVNAALGHVTVEFDPGLLTAREVAQQVRVAERDCGLATAEHAPAVTDHPVATGPLLREAALLGLHLAGATATTVAQAVPLPSPVSLVASTLSLADGVPRVRAAVAALIGDPVAAVLFNAAAGTANTLARRPVGLLADAARSFCGVREGLARRQAWAEWDRMLREVPGAHRAPPAPAEPRPVDLPPGPVERTADSTAALALGGAAALLTLTRSVPLAAAAIAAGAPKAADAGRHGFAAWLDDDLAGRGCLVLHPSALRRLDRVDTVVLDAEALLTGRSEVAEVLPLTEDAANRSELLARAYDMVAGGRRRERRRAEGWALVPLTGPGAELPVGPGAEPPVRGGAKLSLGLGAGLPAEPGAGLHMASDAELPVRPGAAVPPGSDVELPLETRAALLAETRAAAETLSGSRSTLFALRHGDRTRAVVAVTEQVDPFAEALVAAARGAGRVLLAGGPQDLRRRLRMDGAIPGGDDLPDAVRDLQRAGHVVALVSSGNGRALAAADVGVALVAEDGIPAWTAHTLVRTHVQACRVLDAVPVARRVSTRSAQLAAAGSSFGGLFALLGSRAGAPGRAVLPVHGTALAATVYGSWSAITLSRKADPVPVDPTPWHAMSRVAVLDTLGSSRAGLGEEEAARRRRRAAAPVEEIGLARAAVEELATPLTPALAVGAGVSAATGSVLDALLILGVLGVNALIGGVQRVGAQRALRSLRKTSATPVRARRAGNPVEVEASALVPGDVIVLQAGDTVPADCRLLAGRGVEVDESSLTGESVAVAKSVRATGARAMADRTSMLYEGTVVAAGHAEAVVVATGERTEGGRAMRLQEAPPPTGVEQRLRSLTARVLPLSVGAGIALITVDLLRGRPAAVALGRAVSLAVTAVPEGLPFVASMAELAAARRLSRRGALVRNPSTIEALGRVDVLCFDKTGTLTEGRAALRLASDGLDTRPVTGPMPETLQDVVAAALRASPFHLDESDVAHQTDRAVLRGAHELGLPPAFGHTQLEHLAELPFESSRGYHATLWRGATATHVSLKGAPEVVLPLCTRWHRPDGAQEMDDAARERVTAEVHRLAGQGHRVLAVAENDLPETTRLSDEDVHDLCFRGLVALVDPVRPTAAAALATLRAAGVQTVVITGDHPSTAKAIAAELDVVNGRGVLSGAELDALGDDELAEALPGVAVFARVTPAQKARIVRQLQRAGATVAVTGDGTNDAPAIRLADIGIALGARATPAARAAADLVVTDDRIETITDAIVEGRAMWSSVRDALSILLGGNLGEIAYTLGTGLWNGGAALNARQLLLVNLLTDVLPAMAVAVRPPPDVTPEQLLAEGPEGSLGESLDRDIAARAATTAVAAGIAWLLARPVSTPGQASTTGLVALVSAQLGQTLAVRGRTPLVAAATGGSLLLLAAAVQVPVLSRVVGSRPLLPHQWGIGLSAAAAATVAQLLVQALLARRSGPRPVVDADS